MKTHERNAATVTQEWGESVRDNVQRELAAFRQMLPNLLLTHNGEFVALSDGKLIDQDKDEFALAERVSHKFPGKFVFIQEVVKGNP